MTGMEWCTGFVTWKTIQLNIDLRRGLHVAGVCSNTKLKQGRDFNWEDAPLILSCSVCLGCTHSISKVSVCISGFKLTWRFFYCPVEYV